MDNNDLQTKIDRLNAAAAKIIEKDNKQKQTSTSSEQVRVYRNRSCYRCAFEFSCSGHRPCARYSYVD